jgi:predicted Zn-dependent protease
MFLHRIILASITSLLLASGGAHAVTKEEVVSGAEKLYRERIEELTQARLLDRDRGFRQRVDRIAGRLIAQAKRDDPQTADWSWEIHVSSDDDDLASCMAGGKILLSQPYVERLALTDAELAMLLSHEMQHALLLHNWKEYQEALRLDPSWRSKPFAILEEAVDIDVGLMSLLAAFNKEQEIEADRVGLQMAWRAGWPARDLAYFFKKLEQTSTMSNLSRASHPAPMQRWRSARSQADLLGTNTPDVAGAASPSESP